MDATARFTRFEEFRPRVVALDPKLQIDQIFRRQPNEQVAGVSPHRISSHAKG
jgi:hypothetical protein